MPTARILIIVLLLGVPAWAGAQARAPAPAAGLSGVFTGTAQVKNATGALSGTLEVRLRRVTRNSIARRSRRR